MRSAPDWRPVANPDSPWKLELFVEKLDMLLTYEDVSTDLRFLILEWAFTRGDDPFAGVQREPGNDNLWHGTIPRSWDGKGHVIHCSYWVYVASNTVVCNSYGLLSWPV